MPAPLHDDEQDRCHGGVEQAFVQLDGMPEDAIAEVDTPAERALGAIAAAMEEAAPAANSQGTGERQGVAVSGLCLNAPEQLGQFDAQVGTEQAGGDGLPVAGPGPETGRVFLLHDDERQLGPEDASDKRRHAQGPLHLPGKPGNAG